MCFSSSFGSTSAGRFCRNGHLATPHPAGKPSPPTCLGGKGQRDPTSTPRLQMFPVGWRWRGGRHVWAPRPSCLFIRPSTDGGG